jgi:hypothetical protein
MYSGKAECLTDLFYYLIIFKQHLPIKFGRFFDSLRFIKNLRVISNISFLILNFKQ